MTAYSSSRISLENKTTSKTPTLIYKIFKITLCLISFNIFVLGALTIVLQQLLVNIFLSNFVQLKQTLLNDSKKKFIILLITIFRINTPNCKVRITIPKAINQQYKIITKDTETITDLTSATIDAKTHFKDKSVVIANHQIYTDWVYLWWLAYTSNLAGNIYILLKKSLESLPILGYGMKNYNFIFLSRKWGKDKINLHNHLNDINLDSQGKGRLSGKQPETTTLDGEFIWAEDTSLPEENDNKKWPYQLILFPEGTNLSANTKNKSAEFAKKIDRKPFNNVLLPHVTGLYEVLKTLPTCKTLYDLTIAYSGVPQDEFAQDIYTIKGVFLEGKSPAIVDIYINGLERTEIPLENMDVFGEWLFERWDLKDQLMERYYKNNGDFKADESEYDTYLFSCTCSYMNYLSILVTPVLSFVFILKYFIKKMF
ncbi:hypothetical protein ACO0SA_000538 [Hanseniaspora valbyensis]